MTTQPEALALADILDLHAHHAMNGEAFSAAIAAATELRRLHKVNTELLDALRLSADHAHWRDIEAQIRAAINKADRTTT